MARRDSSTDSKESYDSECLDPKGLEGDEKTRCIQVLHCSKAKKKLPNNTFITWTSHWIRRTREVNVSRFAYSLFKVKRWYLTDENFIFDPLKTCNKCEVAPSNTIWRNFPSAQQVEEESSRSVDGLLSQQLKQHQRDMIRKLDLVLEPLNNLNVYDIVSVERQLPELTYNLRILQDKPELTFTTSEFIAHLSQTLIHHATGIKMRETEFEDIFLWLVTCITAALGFPFLNRVKCWRSVDQVILQTVTVPVQTENEEVSLQIKSKPDMFVYKREKLEGGLKNVLCVVEAKGLNDGAIIQSDDESDNEAQAAPDDVQDDDITRCLQHLSTEPKKLPRRGRKGASGYSGEPKLAPLDEDLEEEEEFPDLLDDHPKWLERIPREMQSVVKKFLPQLMGEMFCCARSANLLMKTPNGLHFGIGLVGFEIYFVTMKESCGKDASKSGCIVNKEGHTNLFITRPLKLFARKDRRIIIKTLAALFNF